MGEFVCAGEAQKVRVVSEEGRKEDQGNYREWREGEKEARSGTVHGQAEREGVSNKCVRENDRLIISCRRRKKGQ